MARLAIRPGPIAAEALQGSADGILNLMLLMVLVLGRPLQVLIRQLLGLCRSGTRQKLPRSFLVPLWMPPLLLLLILLLTRVVSRVCGPLGLCLRAVDGAACSAAVRLLLLLPSLLLLLLLR